MGGPDITRFLTWLAVDGKVAASTQNQALSALLCLYRSVLDLDVPWLDDIVPARRPERLPVVLTRDEVPAVLHELDVTRGSGWGWRMVTTSGRSRRCSAIAT